MDNLIIESVLRPRLPTLLGYDGSQWRSITSSSFHLDYILCIVSPISLPLGENGRVSYSILDGNVGDKFSIESSTGILSCLPLDRETKESYHLVILAKDNGGEPPLGPKSASATIVVNVVDVNDNDPTFSQRNYHTTIREDTPLGARVITVLATDKDKGNNSIVTYSLDNATTSLFRIDPNSGIITTAGPFDREKKDRFVLMVLT